VTALTKPVTWRVTAPSALPEPASSEQAHPPSLRDHCGLTGLIPGNWPAVAEYQRYLMIGSTGICAPQRSVGVASVARVVTGGADIAAGAGIAPMIYGPNMPGVPVPVPPFHDQDMSMARQWPLRTSLELGAYPEAVTCARLHARAMLWEWGLSAHREQVDLIVSELTTNAIKASADLITSRFNRRWIPGKPPVRLWIESDRAQFLVLVWDGNDREPQRQEPDLDADHGRGLVLVEALSTKWGSFRPTGASGKVVWALCERGDEAG